MVYKVFVDKWGSFYEGGDYQKAVESFNYVAEEKKRSAGKFADKNIYLLQIDNRHEVVLDKDEKETFELGGEIVSDTLNSITVSQFINGFVGEKSEQAESKKYYYNGDNLFVKKGNNVIDAVKKIGQMFVINKSAIADNKELLQKIESGLKKFSVTFK